jgi:hypothetical protein
MSTFPYLVRAVSPSGQVRFSLGDRLVDRYLEFVLGCVADGRGPAEREEDEPELGAVDQPAGQRPPARAQVGGQAGRTGQISSQSRLVLSVQIR